VQSTGKHLGERCNTDNLFAKCYGRLGYGLDADTFALVKSAFALMS
jgi:hypothetical protein